MAPLSSPSQIPKPQIPAAPMGLFPTMGSLNEVIELAESKLPIDNTNDVIALLMTYHNTFLKVLGDQRRITLS